MRGRHAHERQTDMPMTDRHAHERQTCQVTFQPGLQLRQADNSPALTKRQNNLTQFKEADVCEIHFGSICEYGV